jgi:TRAP-type C4-dicarboxylate transport system substrate-binding protein
MPHRKVLATLAIALTCGLGCGIGWSPAGAASFDVAIFVTERDAFVDAYKFWSSEVEKRTQGRVQFKPSYSGALTSAVETLGAVRSGVVPIGLSAASFGSGAMPALGYLEAMGGLPNDPDGMRQALDAVNQPLADMLQKYGVELLYTQPTFDLVVVCGGKHLKAVSDWPGTKVRAAGRWQSQQVLALGGAPTAIDPGEQYLALQNKTVDCALSVPTLVLSLKLYEVAPKLTSLRQAVNTSLLVMNPRSWRSISAEDQATIRTVSTETRHRAVVRMREIADKGMADLKALGSDIYTLSDAELRAMKDKMKPVFDKIGEGAGDAGKPFAAALKQYW